MQGIFPRLIGLSEGKGLSPGRLVGVLALMIALLPGVAAAPVNASAKAQRQLLELAASNPDVSLSVIVQKTSSTANVEGEVAELGGTVTKDLHIINAFAAKVPGRSIAPLSALPNVRWVSLDGPVVKSGTTGPISTANLASAYVRAVAADRVWNEAPSYYQGQQIGVAVVDSGVNLNRDLASGWGNVRVTANVAFNDGGSQTWNDNYGHGTHVAGIIAGNGASSNGTYIGIAPNSNIINVKVSDDQGSATASDVVEGLQWINDNQSTYNIRVVNLSLNSTAPSSYHTDPIDAAAEILWFNRIVVVVSAGNYGTAGALYAPANDPFVITVGATDDRGTNTLSDDTLAPFSAYGVTTDGVAKPDIVAPGTNIVSLLSADDSTLATTHRDHVVYLNGSTRYFRMSGTSMSAPMVAGAAALLLQSNPNLNPDQVKYRLKATALPFDTSQRAGAGLLNVYAAVHGNSNATANTNTSVSRLLLTGSEPLTWSSVNWNSVNWNSVNWNSVNWNSVNWNSVNWNSDWWDR